MQILLGLGFRKVQVKKFVVSWLVPSLDEVQNDYPVRAEDATRIFRQMKL